MRGWIKVYRDLLDKPIWVESTPEQKTILITLLMMVNHQRKDWEWKGRPYSVKPGQVVTSLDSILKKCGKGISIQNVRTALKRFERYEFLTNKSTNKSRLITIINWELYQHNEDELTSKLTAGQQAHNKYLTTIKNDKELKNDKKVKNTLNPEIVSYDECSVPFQLSLRLFNNIKKNNKGFKEPNLQKWSDDFRLMIERDKRSKEQIAYLIDWCQQDTFWKSNILSPAKLRKQFDQLVAKVNSEQQKNQKRSLHKISLERPGHWQEPKPLTKEELNKMKQWEAELPY